METPGGASTLLHFRRSVFSCRDSEFFDPPAVSVLTDIGGGAAFIKAKERQCSLLIAVDLPEAAADTSVGPLFDEACHILCRISQEETDLVGKVLFMIEAVYKDLQALA